MLMVLLMPLLDFSVVKKMWLAIVPD